MLLDLFLPTTKDSTKRHVLAHLIQHSQADVFDLDNQQVNELEKNLNELRVAAAPKPRFAFKRKAAPTPSPSPATPAESPQPQPASPPTQSQSPSSNSFISSHERKYLAISSLIGAPPTSDLTISNLDHCILNLVPTTALPHKLDISAVHLREITNSILLLPIINGSILIHELSNCAIVLGCHQVI
ncbi:hypothetical protein NP233_g11395 [Leucocoprinus birnbaumii]|uniref:C-CAP/cofactor C-like domain-containing protein n=1 Tax=Leucocoprinus birnbaumii TaxID=56174 RepID=A0AAD5YP06_9AGAR|nr:hypothetical protein NP233_g11395 [Leucocoprinus birnbaumii]